MKSRSNLFLLTISYFSNLLNFSLEFGSSCSPGRSDVSSFSFMEDPSSFDVVVGLPYCGENGGLVLINRNGDDILSDWKLIFPFDSDVWKASIPSLSNVDLPAFPNSIRYFGYRIIPSPDFNDDGQDDLWVVSFLNELDKF